MESRLTAVRRISIGVALVGTLRRKSMMRGSSSRAAASSAVKSASSACGGQLAEPEQIGGLFEGGLAGELVDIDATIGEDAGLSVDEADG